MKTRVTFFMIAMLLVFSCGEKTKETSEGSTKETIENLDKADEGHGHSHDDEPEVKNNALPKQVVAATEFSPEYIQLATNVEIIPNINDAANIAYFTHEGAFGALLYAEKMNSFFIDLKPGMFLSEHPHSTESLAYTIKGKWVLCSEGKRQVMEAGSFFHFGSNMPTGWEAPFAEGALLLVVKSNKPDIDYSYEYEKNVLINLRKKLDEERKNGAIFYYNELKPNHAAIQFAKSVNPNFDEVLNNISY